jgi:hypothetical protein
MIRAPPASLYQLGVGCQEPLATHKKTVKLGITNVRPAVGHAMRIANAMGKAGKFLRMYLMHSGRAELRVLFRILSCARGLVVLRTSKDYDF